MARPVISHQGAGGGVIGTVALRTVAVALRHGVGVPIVKCTEWCGSDRARGFGRAADHAGRCADGAIVKIISAAIIRPAIALIVIRRLIALIVIGALVIGVALIIVALRTGPGRA